MRFTSFAECRNSPSSGRPSTSTAIDWLRSPFATAPIVRVTSVVGRTKSSINVFNACTSSAQPPTIPVTAILCRRRPSLPTTRDTLAASRALRSLMLSTSLNASASFPCTPLQPLGSLAVKSPSRNASIAASRSISHASPLPLPFVAGRFRAVVAGVASVTAEGMVAIRGMAGVTIHRIPASIRMYPDRNIRMIF